MGEGNWVVVLEADPVGAELARSVLEGSGIPVRVSGEEVANLFGVGVGAVGNVRVLVPEERRAEAEEVLQSADGGTAGTEGTEAATLAPEAVAPAAGDGGAGTAPAADGALADLSRERLELLLADFAKRWLAHDGLWFQAVEGARGMEEAIRLDAQAWKDFSALEARRIVDFLGMEPGGGLEALARALEFRLYAFVNRQEALFVAPDRLVFRMNSCRVQEARKRKGVPDFPCKEVGLVEYSVFAATIDPRIKTRCLACPPDEHPEKWFCAWEFTLD